MKVVGRLAVVVASVLVVGLPASASGASPGPSGAAPGSSPKALPFVAAELQGSWVGDPRTVEGLALDPAYSSFSLSDYTFRLEAIADVGSSASLVSSATTPAPGQLRLQSAVSGTGCAQGDDGLYDWSLSQGGTRLTIEPVSDPCAPRAEVLTGAWTRASCEIDYVSCMGVLPAGTYTSGFFDPRSPGGDAWSARSGALTYDVPEGWANLADWPMAYILGPQAAYEQQRRDSESRVDQVVLWARPAAMQSDSPCTPVADPSVDRSVDGLLAWLTAHPGLVVSDPEPITIDGNKGQMVDLDLAPTWTGTCADWGDIGPFIPLFADAAGFDEAGAWQNESYFWGPGGTGDASDPIRVILLDLGGQTFAISVDSATPDGQAALVDQAMPVIEGFTFPE
jgi:hypothetical protein